jgi:hypothetical protein
VPGPGWLGRYLPRATPLSRRNDLAVAIVLGGDCLSDLAVVRSQPDLFGHVASDPTVSRLITTLAGDAGRSLVALRTARAIARQQAWELVPVPGLDRS